jgi:hypothetical protein
MTYNFIFLLLLYFKYNGKYSRMNTSFEKKVPFYKTFEQATLNGNLKNIEWLKKKWMS